VLIGQPLSDLAIRRQYGIEHLVLVAIERSHTWDARDDSSGRRVQDREFRPAVPFLAGEIEQKVSKETFARGPHAGLK